MLCITALMFSSVACAMTDCGVVSSAGWTSIENSIGSGSVNTCIEVTGVTGGSPTIYCASGVSVTARYSPIYVHDNTNPVYIYNCYFTTTGGQGAGQHVELEGVKIVTSGNTWTINGPINLGGSHSEMVSDTFYLTSIQTNAYLPVISSNTIDLSGATTDWACAICIYNSTADVENNVITGNLGHVDDGIVFNEVSGGYYYGNTITNVYDGCIEQVGSSSGVYVQATTCNNASVGLFVCYHGFGCSITGMNFATNVLNGPTSAFLFNALGDGTYFTDNTILTNTNNSGGGSAFGSNGSGGPHWGTVSGNYMYGNSWGGPLYTDYPGTSGWSDGGANYCTSTNSSQITCH